MTCAGITEAENNTGIAGVGMRPPPSEVVVAAGEGFLLDRLWGHCEAQSVQEPQYKDRTLSLQRFFCWSIKRPQF